eukprot:4310175-Prymnesium_polylepis.1
MSMLMRHLPSACQPYALALRLVAWPARRDDSARRGGHLHSTCLAVGPAGATSAPPLAYRGPGPAQTRRAPCRAARASSLVD